MKLFIFVGVLLITQVKGVPVIAAWRVLELRMGETASRYGGSVQIYWISSLRQPARGSPPAWDLDEGLTTPRRINQLVMKCYAGRRTLTRFLENGYGIWNVDVMAGTLKTAASELIKYSLHLEAYGITVTVNQQGLYIFL
jgi:hypothetical protein